MTTSSTKAKSKLKSLSIAEKLKIAMETDADEVPNSLFSRAKHIIGSVDSGIHDLSYNKEYLKGYGQNRNENNS